MKVLLIIYIISIIYFIVNFFLLCAVITNRAKKEGLKFEKMSIAEIIQTYLRTIIFAIFPIFNIIVGTFFLFSNDFKDLLMEEMREKSIWYYCGDFIEFYEVAHFTNKFRTYHVRKFIGFSLQIFHRVV